MPYGNIAAYLIGSRITMHIELPDCGEPSQRGRAEVLTNEWCTVESDDDELQIKVIVCRPYRRRHRSGFSSSGVSYAARA